MWQVWSWKLKTGGVRAGDAGRISPLTGAVSVCLKTSTGKVFSVIAAFENDVEVTLYRHGGLLNFVARKFS